MKRLLVDLYAKRLTKWAELTRFKNQFKKYWGTTTVNGIEVFNYSQGIKYLPEEKENWLDEDNRLKLLRMLGVYSDLKTQDWKGVEDAWLYLNPTKGGFTKESEKTNLRIALDDAIGTTLKGTINIAGYVESEYDSDGGTSYTISNPMNTVKNVQFDLTAIEEAYPGFTAKYQEGGYDEKEMLYAKCVLAYADLWNTCKISATYDQSGEEPDSMDNKFKEILLMYLMFSEDVDYTITKVSTYYTTEQVQTQSKQSNTANANYRTFIVPTISIDVTIDPTQIVPLGLDIVDLIYADILGANANNINETLVAQKLDSMYDVGELDAEDEFSQFWLRHDGRWYLRVDAIEGDMLKADGSKFSLKERVEYLQSTIDQDYRKKKASTWKKVLVIVIVVIAVVIAVVSLGSGAGFSAYLIAAATALVYTSLVIALLSYAAAKWGDEDTAMALGEANSTIAPAVKIAGIILLINGLANLSEAAQQAAEDAAVEEAKNAATEELTQVAIDEIKKQAQATAMDYMKTYLTSNWMSITNTALTKVYEHKLGEQQDQIDKMKTELTKQEEAKETNLLRDYGKDYIKMYAELIQQDQAQYAYTEVPYIPMRGPYHTGNMLPPFNAFWFSKV